MRRNNITIGKVVTKKYSIKERFESEIYYNEYFYTRGFSVPKIISKNVKLLSIDFDRVYGPHPEKMSDHLKVVEYLAKVVIETQKEFEEKKSFQEKVKSVINNYHNLVVRPSVLERLTSYPQTLFIDSKKENWIIDSDDTLWKVDFDYVVPSHIFQDLAQFIGSIDVNQREKMKLFYLYNEILGRDYSYDTYLLFEICILLSNTKKLLYGNDSDIIKNQILKSKRLLLAKNYVYYN